MAPRTVEITAKFADGVVAMRRVGGSPASSRRPFGVGIACIAVGVVLIVAEIASLGSLVILPIDGTLTGLALVLVGMVLASVGGHRRAEPDADAFWLGQRADVDVAVIVPGLAADERLPVVRRTATGIELRFVPGMEGTFQRKGESIALADLVDDGPANADGSIGIAFEDAERAELRCGALTLTIQPADGIPDAPRAKWLDGRLAIATVFAAVIVGGTIGVAHFVVPRSRTLPDQEDRPVVYPDAPPPWLKNRAPARPARSGADPL